MESQNGGPFGMRQAQSKQPTLRVTRSSVSTDFGRTSSQTKTFSKSQNSSPQAKKIGRIAKTAADLNPAQPRPSETKSVLEIAHQTTPIAAQSPIIAQTPTTTQKSEPVEQKPAPTTLKSTPINPSSVTKEDWQKYHSAWQGYYQKYYSTYYAKAARAYIEQEEAKVKTSTEESPKINTSEDTNPVQKFTEEFKKRIQKKATQDTKKSQRLRRVAPLLAGLATALIILFMQYNRLIFAPIMAYVSPGNAGSNGITALDPTITTAVGADSRLMIPKLNVDVPVHFGISNDTASIDNAMENGVAQFAIPGASAMPGEIGNLAISGHSAGDIYSNNQYKFIFSGLERLTEGDLIYIDYQGVRYTYSVTRFETVEPTNVAALVYETNKPMLTLITCTPLGTSRYRLLVTAEQISPSPTEAKQQEVEGGNAEMPKNEPTLFESIFGR